MKTQEARKKTIKRSKRRSNSSIRSAGIIAAFAVVAVVVLVCLNGFLVSNGSYESNQSTSTQEQNNLVEEKTADDNDLSDESVDQSDSLDNDSNSNLEEQALPENGYVFTRFSSDKSSEFTVHNHSSSNYFMKFVKPASRETVVSFFVRGNSDATIAMPGGIYELRYTYGSTWYGSRDLFGSKGIYAKDEETYDFSDYASWERSLDGSLPNGETIDVEQIDPDQF